MLCAKRLKSSNWKCINLIFNEIDDLTLNQNSAVEGVQFQKIFVDRLPYNKVQHNSLSTKQLARLREMLCDRTPFYQIK